MINARVTSPAPEATLSTYYQHVKGLNMKTKDLFTSSDGELFDLNNFNVLRAGRNFRKYSKARGGGMHPDCSSQ